MASGPPSGSYAQGPGPFGVAPPPMVQGQGSQAASNPYRSGIAKGRRNMYQATSYFKGTQPPSSAAPAGPPGGAPNSGAPASFGMKAHQGSAAPVQTQPKTSTRESFRPIMPGSVHTHANQHGDLSPAFGGHQPNPVDVNMERHSQLAFQRSSQSAFTNIGDGIGENSGARQPIMQEDSSHIENMFQPSMENQQVHVSQNAQLNDEMWNPFPAQTQAVDNVQGQPQDFFSGVDQQFSQMSLGSPSANTAQGNSYFMPQNNIKGQALHGGSSKARSMPMQPVHPAMDAGIPSGHHHQRQSNSHPGSQHASFEPQYGLIKETHMNKNTIPYDNTNLYTNINQNIQPQDFFNSQTNDGIPSNIDPLIGAEVQQQFAPVHHIETENVPQHMTHMSNGLKKEPSSIHADNGGHFDEINLNNDDTPKYAVKMERKSAQHPSQDLSQLPAAFSITPNSYSQPLQQGGGYVMKTPQAQRHQDESSSEEESDVESDDDDSSSNGDITDDEYSGIDNAEGREQIYIPGYGYMSQKVEQEPPSLPKLYEKKENAAKPAIYQPDKVLEYIKKEEDAYQERKQTGQTTFYDIMGWNNPQPVRNKKGQIAKPHYRKKNSGSSQGKAPGNVTPPHQDSVPPVAQKSTTNMSSSSTSQVPKVQGDASQHVRQPVASSQGCFFDTLGQNAAGPSNVNSNILECFAPPPSSNAKIETNAEKNIKAPVGGQGPPLIKYQGAPLSSIKSRKMTASPGYTNNNQNQKECVQPGTSQSGQEMDTGSEKVGPENDVNVMRAVYKDNSSLTDILMGNESDENMCPTKPMIPTEDPFPSLENKAVEEAYTDSDVDWFEQAKNAAVKGKKSSSSNQEMPENTVEIIAPVDIPMQHANKQASSHSLDALPTKQQSRHSLNDQVKPALSSTNVSQELVKDVNSPGNRVQSESDFFIQKSERDLISGALGPKPQDEKKASSTHAIQHDVMVIGESHHDLHGPTVNLTTQPPQVVPNHTVPLPNMQQLAGALPMKSYETNVQPQQQLSGMYKRIPSGSNEPNRPTTQPGPGRGHPVSSDPSVAGSWHTIQNSFEVTADNDNGFFGGNEVLEAKTSRSTHNVSSTGPHNPVSSSYGYTGNASNPNQVLAPPNATVHQQQQHQPGTGMLKFGDDAKINRKSEENSLLCRTDNVPSTRRENLELDKPIDNGVMMVHRTPSVHDKAVRAQTAEQALNAIPNTGTGVEMSEDSSGIPVQNNPALSYVTSDSMQGMPKENMGSKQAIDTHSAVVHRNAPASGAPVSASTSKQAINAILNTGAVNSEGGIQIPADTTAAYVPQKLPDPFHQPVIGNDIGQTNPSVQRNLMQNVKQGVAGQAVAQSQQILSTGHAFPPVSRGAPEDGIAPRRSLANLAEPRAPAQRVQGSNVVENKANVAQISGQGRMDQFHYMNNTEIVGSNIQQDATELHRSSSHEMNTFGIVESLSTRGSSTNISTEPGSSQYGQSGMGKGTEHTYKESREKRADVRVYRDGPTVDLPATNPVRTDYQNDQSDIPRHHSSHEIQGSASFGHGGPVSRQPSEHKLETLPAGRQSDKGGMGLQSQVVQADEGTWDPRVRAEMHPGSMQGVPPTFSPNSQEQVGQQTGLTNAPPVQQSMPMGAQVATPAGFPNAPNGAEAQAMFNPQYQGQLSGPPGMQQAQGQAVNQQMPPIMGGAQPQMPGGVPSGPQSMGYQPVQQQQMNAMQHQQMNAMQQQQQQFGQPATGAPNMASMPYNKQQYMPGPYPPGVMPGMPPHMYPNNMWFAPAQGNPMYNGVYENWLFNQWSQFYNPWTYPQDFTGPNWDNMSHHSENYSYPSSRPISEVDIDSRPSSVLEEVLPELLESFAQDVSEKEYYAKQATPPPMERLTPLHFIRPHVIARCGRPGAMLITDPCQPQDGVPGTVHRVPSGQLLPPSDMARFPGPLICGETSKKSVVAYARTKAADFMKTGDVREGRSKALLWEYCALLVQRNGVVDGSDVADLILQKAVSMPYSSGDSRAPPNPQAIDTYRSLMMQGSKREAINFAIKEELWGHAFALAYLNDPKTLRLLLAKFLSTINDQDPLATLYSHLGNRGHGSYPYIIEGKGDWIQHLCMLLSNPANANDQNVNSIVALGDTLAKDGQVAGAHLCYLVAGVKPKYHKEARTKMSLLSQEHRGQSERSDLWANNEAIQLTEIFEFAHRLRSPENFVGAFQHFKYLYAMRLVGLGCLPEAFAYLQVISEAILQQPGSYSTDLVANVIRLAENVVLASSTPAEDHPEWIQDLKNVVGKSGSSTKREEQEDERVQSVYRKESKVDYQRHESRESSTTSSEQIELESTTAASSSAVTTGDTHAVSYQEVEYQQSNETGSLYDPVTQDVKESSSSHSAIVADGNAFQAYETQGYNAHETASQYGFLGAQDGYHTTQPEEPQQTYPQSYGQTTEANQVPFYTMGAAQPEPEIQQDVQPETHPEEDAHEEEEDLFEVFKKKNRREKTADSDDSSSTMSSTPKKEAKSPPKDNGANKSGWFSGLLSKIVPGKSKEVFLPDDSDKSIYYDETLGKWVDRDADNEATDLPPPPPTGPMGGAAMPTMPMNPAKMQTPGATSTPAKMPQTSKMSRPGAASAAMPAKPQSTIPRTSQAAIPGVNPAPVPGNLPGQVPGNLPAPNIPGPHDANDETKPPGPPSMFSLRAHGMNKRGSRYVNTFGNVKPADTAPMPGLFDPMAMSNNKPVNFFVPSQPAPAAE